METNSTLSSKTFTRYSVFLAPEDGNGEREYKAFLHTPEAAIHALGELRWQMRFYALLQRSGASTPSHIAEAIRRFEGHYMSIEEAQYEQDDLTGHMRLLDKRLFKDRGHVVSESWSDLQRALDTFGQLE